VMGEFYRTSATRHGAAFTDDTALIWEWFAVPAEAQRKKAPQRRRSVH
jgi:hypothetical protein